MSEHSPARTWFASIARAWLSRPLLAILIMALLWLAIWIAVDRWGSEPDPQFVADGIPLLAWYCLAILALAALLQWRARPTAPFLPVLALAMGAVPAPLLFFAVAAPYLSPAWFTGWMAAVAIYLFLYFTFGLHALTGSRQHRAALYGVVLTAGFIWTTDTLNVIPDVFAPSQRQASAALDSTDDAEEILFGQAAQIDQVLAAVAPAAAAAGPRAFFLGFAGVGEEKVFAQEVGLASRVLSERYAIDSRSVSLVNDERDLHRAPLATVSGLRYALQGLGRRMDPQRDVLFLAISSHGAPDPAIAVSAAQLPLNDLTDQDLADALRESGIKWRVIIISACYAGAFIDSLRDSRTIVITAAAADRTSFGCSVDSDLTYFGEAFYRDALPSARTLHEAFDKAKAAIAFRERREHVSASEPQAYFGAEMEKKLLALEPRIDEATSRHRR